MRNSGNTESNATEEDNIARLASAQVELGKSGLVEMPDRILFLTLRDLYRLHREGLLSLDSCKWMKAEAVRQYRKDKSDMEWYRKQIRQRGLFWQKVEHAGTVYAMSDGRTPEGDALFEAVYGMRPRERNDSEEIPEGQEFVRKGEKD